MNPDAWLFHLINNLTHTFPPLDAAALLIVNDYALPALFAFLVGALWFSGHTETERERYQRGVLGTVVGVLVGNLVVKLFWIAFFRPRPFAVEDGVKLLFYRPSVSSFPSEPVMTLAALAFGVWLCERRLGTVMLVLTAAFAFTRVMAGVHYPTDVVAGALIGGLAVYLPYRHWAGLDRLKTHAIRLAKRFGLA
jgi:undecaprenyl-diphosphatase